jgi:hypothetical protein
MNLVEIPKRACKHHTEPLRRLSGSVTRKLNDKFKYGKWYHSVQKIHLQNIKIQKVKSLHLNSLRSLI